MNDTLDGLLRTILADPEDDVVRLAYADALEEHGGEVECGQCTGKGKQKLWDADESAYYYTRRTCKHCDGSGRVPDGRRERAEFIRAGVEVEAAPPCAYDPGTYGGAFARCSCRRCALRRREREILSSAPWAEWSGCRGLGGDTLVCRNLADLDPVAGDVAFTFRRGFVEAVRAPLAALFGGPCQWCERAVGAWAEPDYRRVCPACSGTGRTPGAAADLFAAQPVTDVVLTDREPSVDPATNGAWWVFVKPTDAEAGLRVADGLPAELIMPMAQTSPGGRWAGAVVGRYTNAVRYPIRDAALSALSSACVALGRGLAGLPPLR